VVGERVAVVGGTGFLGSHIVLQLLETPYTPIVVARTPEKVARVLPGVQVETRQGDVTDLESLRRALEGCTYVHSVAALLDQVFTAATPVQEDEAVRTNVEGMLNVLRAAYELGAKRVILTGSCSTRYTRGGTVATEDPPPAELKLVNDPYVRSKVRGEKAAVAFSRETGLPVVHILPGALIGPGDRGPGPLGTGFIDRLNGVHAPSIEGGFPVTDVRDAACAHIRAMDVEPMREAYLVVAATISMRELHEMATRFAGASPQQVFLSPRVAMVFAFVAEIVARIQKKPPLFTRNAVRHPARCQRYDCSRAATELGITYIPVETTVREWLQWWIDNGMVARRDGENRVSKRRAGLHGDIW
jgi:nucleoside-diphosphate-sugar epimerase